MRISLRFLPVLLFFIFYGLIQFSFSSLRNAELRGDRKETRAMLEIVTDRFKRYLELPYMMGVLGAEFLSRDIKHVNYETYAELVRNANPEFLGFNVMDHEGRIIRTFPDGANARAQGKRSQWTDALNRSFAKGDPFYFSPPFRLFQDQQGFVFYFPVMKGKVHEGWYAIVISSENFLEKFALNDFLRIFDLVILDEQSGVDYFATSMVPDSEEITVFSTETYLYGRKLLIKTWRKEPSPIQSFPWYFSVIISLVFSLAVAFIIRLWGQRRKAREQLENISILLRVTSKEALSNLIEIHSEFGQLNLPEDEKVERLSRDINYLTNLIEQIDLLQTLAHSRESLSGDDTHSFLTILNRQLEAFDDVLERKNVKVTLEPDEFKDFKLCQNEWLFENSVLSNILSHLLIHVQKDSKLVIKGTRKNDQCKVTFHIHRVPSGDFSSKVIGRRLDVARKVLQLQDGDLKEDFDGPEELQVTLVLPK